jgi:Arc/MetJ family transcription regulator
MRTNVVLDDELVRRAFALTGIQTKRELLHVALQELIRVREKRDMAEFFGQVRFHDDFDHKELRRPARDTSRWPAALSYFKRSRQYPG